MTTRHLPASLLILSTLTAGMATAGDPPAAREYPLAKRAPAAGPHDAAGRQERLQKANAKFDKAYGKKAPAPSPKTIRIHEPVAAGKAPGQVGRTTASSATSVRPQTMPRTTASTATSVRPQTMPRTTASTASSVRPVTAAGAGRSTASTASAVRPHAGPGASRYVAQSATRSAAPTATRAATRHAARQAAASRNAAKLVSTTGKGVAGAAIVGGTLLVIAGASELAESGSMPDLGASAQQALNDVATGNVQVKTSEVAGVAKDVLIGNPLSFLAYGASEIARQEEENQGQTLRDLQSGNINIDTGEVAALGVGVAAGAAFGGPVGILGYGAVKIFDQELRDPGKTSRDIKEMTGGAIDLEQTGKDIEKAGQDVGNFVGGLFGGNR